MEQYEAWKALLRAGEATGWQEFYVKFYQAFIDGSRWKQYLNGVGTTLLVTALALTIGIPASFAPAAGLGALLGSLAFLPMFTGLRLTGAIGAAVLARGLGKSWWLGAAAGCGKFAL